ncbi:MAG: caspase family protein [Gammaproteobacteria bacterium]|nr:caspase family protein [Gammaproteobacteria bacterium]
MRHTNPLFNLKHRMINNNISLFLNSLVIAVLITGCATGGSGFSDEAEITPDNVNKLQIVDCLLPGQIRQLGQSFTYVSARRPIRTTAANCELRGGEYVAFDRANYATALKTWQPKANEGDAEAQFYVGEIYEKGLGIAPDYDLAALWYKKAADQGYSSAMVNLGYLYEKGLGVTKDSVKALNLYRKAAGLENTDVAFAATAEQTQAQIESLRQESARYQQQSKQYQQESAQLRQQLDTTNRQLRRTQNQLSINRRKASQERQSIKQLRKELQQKKQSTSTGSSSPAEIALFEQQLKQKETELQKQQQVISTLEDEAKQQKQTLNILKEGAERFAKETSRELDNLRTKLVSSEAQSKSLKQELLQSNQTLQQLQNTIAEQNKNLNQREAALESLRQKLLRKQKQAKTPKQNAELAKLSEALQQREKEMQAQRDKMDELNYQWQMLSRQDQEKQKALKTQSDQIAELQARIDREKEEAALAQSATSKLTKLTAPRIEIIDPPLLAQRGLRSVNARPEIKSRAIIGKVYATGGLMSLIINDVERKVDKSGNFKVNVPLKSAATPVQIVAVDKNMKRSELSFTINKKMPKTSVAQNTTGSLPVARQQPVLAKILPREIFGEYHALLIGNNTYQFLPHLDTAINDAKGIGEVLQNQYGFKTKVLLNATRYDILKALNEYRKTLTEKDNLLLYYAGHGILDKVNNRGHWLPVDAEPDSSANWISVQNVTDQLKIIAAKHVLVVADSCYSGALTRSSIARLEAGMTAQKRAQWIKLLLNARSRVALSSGGLEPVLDGGGGGHSIFAKALIDSLSENKDLMESQALYRNVSALVADAAKEQDFNQVPEYSPIRHAGHAAGEFFFYPAL